MRGCIHEAESARGQARMNVPLVDPTPDLRPAEGALCLDADRVQSNTRGSEIIARRVLAEWDKLMET